MNRIDNPQSKQVNVLLSYSTRRELARIMQYMEEEMQVRGSQSGAIRLAIHELAKQLRHVLSRDGLYKIGEE